MQERKKVAPRARFELATLRLTGVNLISSQVAGAEPVAVHCAVGFQNRGRATAHPVSDKAVGDTRATVEQRLMKLKSDLLTEGLLVRI